MTDNTTIIIAVHYFCAVVLALSFHEFAHAWVAYRYGDSTAYHEGRVTLNPINHLDPMGTVMLLILAFSHVGIGWAKPVPIDPYQFSNPRKHLTIATAAGPLSNLLLAFISIGGLTLFQFFAGEYSIEIITDFLWIFAKVNVGLFIFNMLPFFPLDGMTVWAYFMPKAIAQKFEETMIRWGMMPLLALIIIDAVLKGKGPLGLILFPIINFTFQVLASFWGILLIPFT